ncbi:MAG TPA: leucyl aminopeptidase [Streptosporangiaceae bacterium]|nr:leucyl aminopeptidase [Streptosporangiaceae bacterium]
MTTVLQTQEVSPREAQADALIIGVVPGPDGPVPAPGAQDVDAALGGTLTATLATLGATGAADEITKIVSGGALPAPLIVAAGLGPAGAQQPADPEALRRAAGAAVRSLAGKAPRIAVALPAGDDTEAEAAGLGALLGSYAFTRYRRDQPARPEITLLAARDCTAAARRAQILADAVSMVRDLVNTSPADLYPETFARHAEQVARDSGLDIEVLDEKALAEGGYGGLTGVGQGSVHPPRLVRLSYTRPGAAQTIALVGKGITFDSGGLSLKPAKSMENMKDDMGGAAAVLGALQAIAALQPEVNVVGYLCLAENMPGGGAQRPSDVITIFGGKTVEVLNTDAEGRLVMADGLARSAQDSPDLVIDVATLTGAQVVALGMRIAGVMGSDEATCGAVVDAARRAGEQAWPMPLPEELRKGLDSAVADIANVPDGRDGGMLVAGLFLREFAPDGVRWAHVDIAGPAYHDGEAYGYTPKGGTGSAVRMLVQVAQDAADGRL